MTPGLLDPDATYSVTLAGEQVEVVRRYLINARTAVVTMLRVDPHPVIEAEMRREVERIEALLDLLPVGSVVP